MVATATATSAGEALFTSILTLPALTSAGPLALLHDSDHDVRTYALTHLLNIVVQFWAEISEDLPFMYVTCGCHVLMISETLADAQAGEGGASSQLLAALLCSKVYFYLGERDEAVEFALRAASAFVREPQNEYKETVIAGCIDCAIIDSQAGRSADPRLEDIVAGVIQSGSRQGSKLAVGLALSIRRPQLVESIYREAQNAASSATSESDSPDGQELLRYVLAEAVGGTGGSDAWPDGFRQEILLLLLRLFRSSPHPDYNAITQIWVQLGDARAAADGMVELLALEDPLKQLEAYQIGYDMVEMAPQGFMERLRLRLTESGWSKGGTTLDEIVDGSRSAQLFLNFLSKNNQSDLSVLKATKTALDDRYSLFHSAITFANAYATCGTTSDKFMRENLDWLGRATNWAKFSATASLGLIHRGSFIKGIRVVRPYLPGGSAPSRYSEGGGLFALGLIYAGRKEGPEAELRKNLADGVHPIVQHGAALGIGAAAMASGDEDIYDELKTVLFQDNATSSEAAGYAMGLVMLGQPNARVLEEMTAYAGETQHEKIVRGIAIGVALTMYGRRDNAKEIIDRFISSKDAILRYGGMFTLALAYVGTGDNRVVKQLLHHAVSDVNDDVRRAAVIALGFVLFRHHAQVPRVVQLLAESYNPHVRHGATLALGISCAGTGLDTAVAMLEPMAKDPVDFVRQGAYIALAMILVQQSTAQSAKVATIRELFAKVVADKHEDPMARFGAALAQGIIDAGGRNMTITLATRAGTPDMKAVVAHFLGLTFSPTTVIAVTGDFKVPAVDFISWVPPSKFDYPRPAKLAAEGKKKKTKAAVLSVTARAQARARSKRVAEGEEIDTDDKAEEAGLHSDDGEAKPAEPPHSRVVNMSRIVPAQLPYLTGPFDPPQSSNTGQESSSAEADSPEHSRFTPLRDVGDAAAYRGNRKADGRALPLWSGKVLVVANAGTDEFASIALDDTLWPRQTEAVDSGETEARNNGPDVSAAAGDVVEHDDWSAEMPSSFEYPFEE